MVTITCPWCEEDELFAWLALAQPEATFTCAECGTSISFEDERASVLDPAA
jgi:transcription elongation factor Elf1